MMPTPLHIIRSAQLSSIKSFIDEPELYYRILNISGITGVGKSTFLEHLYNLYAHRRPTAFVSAHKFRDPEYVYRLDDFLVTLSQQLRRELVEPASSGEIQPIDQLSSQLLRYIEMHAQNPLIIIDDYDELPSHPRSIFEDAFLSKIVKLPQRAVIILSSRQKIHFIERLDLRLRATDMELERVKAEEIQAVVPQYRHLASSITQWSAGMPRLVEELIRRTELSQEQGQNKPDAVLIDADYNRQMHKVVLGDRQSTDSGDSEKMAQIIDVISLLRRFDIGLLKLLMPQINADLFSPLKHKDYLDLIRDLGSRVQWQPASSGYTLDAMLKHMLASYIRAFDPEGYTELNRKVFDVYRTLLEQRYQVYYMTELLYHQAMIMLAQDESAENIKQSLTRLALEYVEKRQLHGPRGEELDELGQRLKQDEEIGRYIDEKFYITVDGSLD